MTDARSVLVPDESPEDANQDDLAAQEQSITQPATEQTTTTIPEKYRDKSLEEVIEMHQHAERALGQKNHELGQWRTITSELIGAKRGDDLGNDTEADELELSSDDLFDNPTDAIARVVRKQLEEAIGPIRQSQQIDEQERQLATLREKYPDVEQVARSPEFVEWVNRSPYRQADAQRVADGDLTAADRLLGDYQDMLAATGRQDTTRQTEPRARQSGVEAARAAATERGGTSGAIASGQTYTVDDLVRIQIHEPAKYRDPGFQAELRAAIREKRVRGL